MTEPSIYGSYKETLETVMQDLTDCLRRHNEECKEKTGEAAYEHLSCRIKSEESMREKCIRKGLPCTEKSALFDIHDAVGIRVVCCFLNDIYDIIEFLGSLPHCCIVQQKDYIRNAKPNGYRSCHLIVETETAAPDVLGRTPGRYFAEIQLRTIAMDSWASLEHQMKYKKNIRNPEMITRELKRCADELASCDLSMQTIRDLIRREH